MHVPTERERLVLRELCGIGRTAMEQVFSSVFQIATRHDTIVMPLSDSGYDLSVGV